MTQNAEKLYTHLTGITSVGSLMPGNTVQDEAAQLGFDQGEIEAAIDELERAGLARMGTLWSGVGDHRLIVALGAAQYGPRSDR